MNKSLSPQEEIFRGEVANALYDFLEGRRELVNGRQMLKCSNKATFIQTARRSAERNGLDPGIQTRPSPITDITGSPRLGLVFDQFISSFRGHLYWMHGIEMDILQEWPALRVGRWNADSKVHPSLDQIEGRVVLKTDLEFWLHLNRVEIGGTGVPWPPFGPLFWESCFDVEEVDRGECDELGLVKMTDILTPPPMNFHPHFAAGGAGISVYLAELLDRLLFENRGE